MSVSRPGLLRRPALATSFLVGAVLASGAGSARAQARRPEPPAPSAQPPAPPAPKVSGLAYLSLEIARALGAIPQGTIVVTSPLVSDAPAPKGEELVLRVAAQVAGRVGAKAHPTPAPLAVARGVSGRAASLVYLQIEIAKGELRVTADLYPVVANGWERLRNPLPGPRAHAFASAALDAEIRTFLVPLTLEQTSLHRAKHDEADVLAVGCGDLDGDGGLDLVLVSRARVAVGRLRGGRFVVDRAAPWSTLAPRAPVPMREPLAGVVVSPRDHRGELFVGTTDRGGVSLDAALAPKRTLTGIPVPGGEGDACALVNAELGSFEGVVVSCVVPARGDPPPVLAPPAPRYDAISSIDAVTRDGAVVPVVAVREPSGKVRVRRSDADATRPNDVVLDGVGAQIALVDLDLDGAPEIATTTETEPDVLVVSTMSKNGATARLRFQAKDGVRAVAACAPEAKGAPGLVAITTSEVWLVR